MAHPDRLKILNLLIKKGAQNGKQIYAELGMPQSTMSQHLTKLKMHGLIYGRRKRVEVYYDINDNLIWGIMGVLNEEILNSIIS
ncbi:ArsR family transcriptional regulator [Bacillus sp. AR18-7]|nr:ArsR family transcriptional regulator [Bacillus sp. AR18-7]